MVSLIINFDWAVLNWIQTVMASPIMDALMRRITMFGNFGSVWIVWSAVLICIKEYRKQGILLLAALAVGFLVGDVFLKNFIARPRPSWIQPDFSLLIKNPMDFSFPSGHTLSSTIAAAMLTFINRRFAYVAIPLAALIAFSRMYIYVHFPSDVLAGAAIGILIALAFRRMFSGQRRYRLARRHSFY